MDNPDYFKIIQHHESGGAFDLVYSNNGLPYGYKFTLEKLVSELWKSPRNISVKFSLDKYQINCISITENLLFLLYDYLKNNTVEIELEKPTPYKHQVGGGHYQKTIQPLEFINANKFGFNKGNVIKYITRHEEKNGIEDLKKVIHYTLFEAFHSYPEQYEQFLKDVHKMLGDE